MKAQIKKDGTLEVKAETETEAFALKRWFESYTAKDKTTAIQCDWQLKSGEIKRKAVETEPNHE